MFILFIEFLEVKAVSQEFEFAFILVSCVC